MTSCGRILIITSQSIEATILMTIALVLKDFTLQRMNRVQCRIVYALSSYLRIKHESFEEFFNSHEFQMYRGIIIVMCLKEVLQLVILRHKHQFRLGCRNNNGNSNTYINDCIS